MRRTESALSSLVAEFNNAGSIVDENHDAVGDNDLLSALSDFASNWKYHKSGLVKSLEGVEGLVKAALHMVQGADGKLAQSVSFKGISPQPVRSGPTAITVSLLLDRVLLAYFVFVGTDGRCLHRTAVGPETIISEMWPEEVMRQFEEYDVLTDSIVARNYHDLNRKFPGASRFWMLRSPGLVVSVVVGFIFLAAIVITVVAVNT